MRSFYATDRDDIFDSHTFGMYYLSQCIELCNRLLLDKNANIDVIKDNVIPKVGYHSLSLSVSLSLSTNKQRLQQNS